MDSPDQQSMRGTMLWFNDVKDAGMILGDDGERFPVSGHDFVDGKRPLGRCSKVPVSFEVIGSGERTAGQVALVVEESHGRARLRHSTRHRF
jgi:hypothetical protein